MVEGKEKERRGKGEGKEKEKRLFLAIIHDKVHSKYILEASKIF